MTFCKRCFYSSEHPLGILLDEEGICTGCRVHEEKLSLNWQCREQELRSLLEQYRHPTGRNYDCIVPVSGGRDSYFIVHLIKNVYKMNPLLVHYNKHYNTQRGIRNFSYLKTLFNCDAISMVVNPVKVKRITRYTLKKMGSIYWHVIAGQTVFPVQTAVRFNIPLIIWGAHQGLEQVGMYRHTDSIEMTRKYRKEHDLMGYEAEDLLGEDSPLRYDDISSYTYPSDEQIAVVGVRGIYLGNYIPWDTKRQHEEMIKLYGYETADLKRTFDTYSDVDCLYYTGVHDYIKQLKHGYGKVRDHVCREIRWGRLSREEAHGLIKHYESVEPTDLDEFLEWIGMDVQEFHAVLEPFRNLTFWELQNGQWRLKTELNTENSSTVEEVREWSSSHPCHFIITPSRDPSADESRTVLLSKGYCE